MATKQAISFSLSEDGLITLKSSIFKTAGSKVGNSVIFSDNSGAYNIL